MGAQETRSFLRTSFWTFELRLVGVRAASFISHSVSTDSETIRSLAHNFCNGGRTRSGITDGRGTRRGSFVNLANASREALRQAVANGSVVSWQHMINRRYSFADKAVIRNYFTQLTGLFKNLKCSHDGSSFYDDYFAKIRDLANAQTR